MTRPARDDCADWLRAELEAEERGGRGEHRDAAGEAHAATCARCRDALAEARLIRQDLARITASPRPNWETEVMAKIDSIESMTPAKAFSVPRLVADWFKSRWVWAAVPMAAVTASLLIFARSHNSGPASLMLDVHVETAADRPQMRGDLAVGDTLVMEAAGITTTFADFRVYQDGQGLRFHCAGGSCARDGTRLRGRFRIPSVGRYRVLMVTAPRPVPVTEGSFDEAVGVLAAQPAAVWRAGKTVEIW